MPEVPKITKIYIFGDGLCSDEPGAFGQKILRHMIIQPANNLCQFRNALVGKKLEHSAAGHIKIEQMTTFSWQKIVLPAIGIIRPVHLFTDKPGDYWKEKTILQ